MEPEAVAPGLVAGQNLGRVGKPEAVPGPLDLASETVEVAGRDGPEARLLGHARGEGEAPGGPTELEGEVELGRTRKCRIVAVGR